MKQLAATPLAGSPMRVVDSTATIHAFVQFCFNAALKWSHKMRVTSEGLNDSPKINNIHLVYEGFQWESISASNSTISGRSHVELPSWV